MVLLVVAVGARTAQALRDLHANAASPRTTSSGGAGPAGPTRSTDRQLPRHPVRARHASKLANLTKRLAAKLDSPQAVSLAAVDLTSGRHFRYGATHGMVDASVSKLDILEALLLHHQRDDTPIDGEDDLLATSMIEHSDNGAGQTLWNELGYAPSIAAANAKLGLRRTVPDPAGYYGLTTSCAADQLALLENLVSRDGPLTRQSRKYALTLLGDVESDQRWGVPAAADHGTWFVVKNGWMPADDGGWIVNSDGIITVGGDRVLIAVMTRDNATEQDGITLVESIARKVAAALT